MFAFGVAITSDDQYTRWARPSIQRVSDDEARLLERRGFTSIQAAYNSILEEASCLPDLEALILIHQDVQILDDEVIPKLRSLLEDPSVGIVGVIGGRGLRNINWAQAETTFGSTYAPAFAQSGVVRAHIDHGTHEIDSIDGIFMALSRSAVVSLRFDERFAPLHGYDSDYCLQARAFGLKVLVTDLSVIHHQGRMWDSAYSWMRSYYIWHKKWAPDRLTIPSWLIPELPDGESMSQSWDTQGGYVRSALVPRGSSATQPLTARRRSVVQDVSEGYFGLDLRRIPGDLRLYEHLLYMARPDRVLISGHSIIALAMWFRDRLRAMKSYSLISGYGVISIEAGSEMHSEYRTWQGGATEADSITVLDGRLEGRLLQKRLRQHVPGEASCLVFLGPIETTAEGQEYLEILAEFVTEGNFIIADTSACMPSAPESDPARSAWGTALAAWPETSEGSEFRMRRDLEVYGASAHVKGIFQRLRPRL